MSEVSEPPFITAMYAATFTGKQIDFDHIRLEDISIVDIAVGLSQQCRYAGQVWPFYSVAEHSVLVSQLVPQQPRSRLPLQALMHDGPEYILNDMIRPVKRRITGYDDLEDRVMYAIDKRFRLDYTVEAWKSIKHFDDLITVAERRKLMPRLDPAKYGRGVNELDVPQVHFKCMSPPVACLSFLHRFMQLTEWTPDSAERELIEMIMKTRF
jgi:hypothetical protein